MTIREGDVREILLDIRGNDDKLKTCHGHEFEIGAANRYTCARCGGTANAVEVMWYERGMRHALGGRHG